MDTTTTTTTTAGTVKVGRTTYTAEHQAFANGHVVTWLTGPRGGQFFLREITTRGKSTGLFEAASLTTSSTIRDRGNAVRFVVLAGLVEVAA